MKSNIMMMQSQMLSSSFSFINNNLGASSGGRRRRPSSSALSFHHQSCFTFSFKLRLFFLFLTSVSLLTCGLLLLTIFVSALLMRFFLSFRISTHTTYSRKSGGLQISCDYSCFQIKDLSYRPPGTKTDLLRGVNLSLRENSLGLIFGRSGSGKTTLLQLIAGLCKPMSGSICVQKYGDDGCPCGTSELLFSERVGIVFQFPERYFVAENVLDEVTFGWPRQKSSQQLKELLALRLQKAFTSVGLNSIALDRNPHSLSGGYKRRLALAIQLVQAPVLLLLDEPLAGLDWKARADVVKLLMHLKKELTLLVVSHDLKELSPLVDESWRMEMGGTLVSEPLMMV